MFVELEDDWVCGFPTQASEAPTFFSETDKTEPKVWIVAPQGKYCLLTHDQLVCQMVMGKPMLVDSDHVLEISASSTLRCFSRMVSQTKPTIAPAETRLS